MILPGTERETAEGGGGGVPRSRPCRVPPAPSTMLRTVPLPVPGRIGA
jgi:hypothetical protein